MSPLHVGIVGMGAMGRTHLEAWRNVEGVDVVGVVSSHPREGVDVYETIDLLLERARPELVSVCTPTDTHEPIVRQLIAAGCDVICEKPLALTADTASSLFDAAETAGCMLAVGHVVRHFPQYAELRRLLEQGRLGTPSTVRMRRAVPWPTGSANWFSDESRSGGVVFDLMIHDIDFLVGEWGRPARAFARRADANGLCVITATLQFSNGLLAHIEALWGGVTELEYSCEVAGSAGAAEFSSRRSAGVVITSSLAETIRHESPTLVNPYAAQLRHLADVKRAGGFHIADRQAIETIATCQMIERALRTGEPVNQEKVQE